MEVIDEWTGRRAMWLRRALRMTVESFAGRLGAAVRTVAKWNAEPDLVPTVDMQHALDTLLSQAPGDVRSRFALLAHDAGGPTAGDIGIGTDEAPSRLTDDHQIVNALRWLDRAAGWESGTARSRVAQHLSVVDRRRLQDRGHRRGQVSRRDIAEALASYYRQESADYLPYSVRTDAGRLESSILTRAEWLDLAIPLGGESDDLRFSGADRVSPVLDSVASNAALQRIADVVALDMLMVNAPIYRLTDLAIEGGRISGVVALADFVEYALTMDLLENELIDLLVDGGSAVSGRLPLRDRYLPDVVSVLNVQGRFTAGGVLALTAIARPAGRRNPKPDYLLLIQERSGRVLNASRRLAVIPKSFHGPLVDYRADAVLGATLEREMEEELFGRTEVDSTQVDSRSADPMHLMRLSEPMRWLVDRPGGDYWRMECTGFGLNLVSGNYEFASLLIIDYDEWWDRFGGHIEANWETGSLRRYSSLDRDGIAALIYDESWSNEGLFALVQGLRRLAETGGDRVKLPIMKREF